MKKLYFLFLFSYCLIVYSQPTLFPQPLSPRIANYDIDVRLDGQTKMLHGSEVLKWFNKSTDVINELRFHLYMNAFRNSQSTFLKESPGRIRGTTMEKDNWGFIEVKKIAMLSGEDITSKMQFIQPDDGNTEDKTVFSLPLAQPLNPGDSISLSIEFDEKLPDPPIARTGSKKEFIFVGQWFPKVGVYFDNKWNCHQFHSNSEFFADFGVYNVRITVPEKNIVGATGQEYDMKNNGDGTATHFYHAEDVHDFSWTTSPEYREITGEEAGVKIRVLMQPDHWGQAQRHLDAAKLSIRYFHNWYGIYPFSNLTVVDPRRGASETGGMEYPTLITAGTAYGVPDELRLVEIVIVHEFGHNYWYHLLASNEFEESWMDEGINTYTEIQIMHDAYGSGDALNCLGLKMTDMQLQRGEYLSIPTTDPTVRNAWDYSSSSSYAVNSYPKPGLFLTTLQNYIGKEMMLKVMRAYVDRWKFKHPKSQDFVNVVNDVTGKDFNWFFNEALYTAKKLDYSVESITSYESNGPQGFDYDVTDQHISAKQKDTTTQQQPKKSDQLYASEVLVRRVGEFTFPVELEVAFENGDKVREQWDGMELWKKFKYTKPSKLVYATVDPDWKIPLDFNYTNNSKTMEMQSAGINKTAFKVMFYLQTLLDQPDLLNGFTFFPSAF